MAPIHTFCASVFMALLLMAQQANGQGQGCLETVQGLMKRCAEGRSISHPNFLWFVTNGTSSNGRAPQNPDAFKDQICQVEPDVGGCIFSQVVEIANSSACVQAPAVLQNVQTVLITYDNKCANPCRFTLIDALRECYTGAGLDTALFLNNRTAGQVIGTTDAEVDDFCSKKDALLSCMKPIHDSCPESLPILSSVDFHLPSYEKGVNILCKHPRVYLKGLECFREPTNEVEKCVQEGQQSFLQANVEAQSKNWTQERFLEESCRVTIKQADCDLNSWLKKNHEACNKATVGLRRELECNLMPPNCTVMQKTLYDEACHQDKFGMNERENGGSGSSSGSGGGSGSGGSGGAASGIVPLLAVLLPAVTAAFLFPVAMRIDV